MAEFNSEIPGWNFALGKLHFFFIEDSVDNSTPLDGSQSRASSGLDSVPREDKENTENTEAKETKENKENKEDKEDKEDKENQENQENKENKENQENKENKEENLNSSKDEDEQVHGSLSLLITMSA